MTFVFERGKIGFYPDTSEIDIPSEYGKLLPDIAKAYREALPDADIDIPANGLSAHEEAIPGDIQVIVRWEGQFYSCRGPKDAGPMAELHVKATVEYREYGSNKRIGPEPRSFTGGTSNCFPQQVYNVLYTTPAELFKYVHHDALFSEIKEKVNKDAYEFAQKIATGEP